MAKIIHFSGHMISTHPNKGRFPAQEADRVASEIRKILDSLRVDLWVLKECKLPSARLLAKVRDRKRDLLEVCAAAVGIERGKRIGKQAAQNMIMEARKFASLQLANSAPWLAEAEEEEDGD